MESNFQLSYGHWVPKRRLLYFRRRGNSQKNVDYIQLSCSQEPPIGTYPEPPESTPQFCPVSLRCVLILSLYNKDAKYTLSWFPYKYGILKFIAYVKSKALFSTARRLAEVHFTEIAVE